MGFLLNPHRYGVGANDPYWSSTVLLLGFNANSSGAQFADESFANRGDNGVTNPEPTLDTTIKKFGAGSASFDGSSQWLAWSDSAAWHFDTGDFTIEFWIRFDAAKIESEQTIISQWVSSTNNRSWIFQYRGADATNVLRFTYSTNGTSTAALSTSSWTPTASQWYHIAIDRASGTLRIYVDGVMLASASAAVSLFNATADLRIGSHTDSGGSGHVDGNMDEVRITKGVARYASNSGYTVPTAAFPRS